MGGPSKNKEPSISPSPFTGSSGAPAAWDCIVVLVLKVSRRTESSKLGCNKSDNCVGLAASLVCNLTQTYSFGLTIELNSDGSDLYVSGSTTNYSNSNGSIFTYNWNNTIFKKIK